MNPRSILLLLSLLGVRAAWATHIIGGELYYTYLGSDNYEVTLKLYRDCGPNNSNGTGFDASVDVGVFDMNNVWLFSETLFFPGAVQVPVILNNPCLTPPATICVEEADYVGTINLPSGTGGYTLAFQRCCRTPIVVNLDAPNTQGITVAVQVPDASVQGDNSSPRFAQYPPIALCANEAMVFDHSATDPDGDQLVYELTTPFSGGSQFNPLPIPPDPPPYVPVIWASGYSQANMINSSPVLAIDANTGELTVTPTMLGSFTIGVMVKEYRNQVLLSEVRRDFRFDVVPCVLNVVSAIQLQQNLCTGTTISFSNLSSGATSWLWDFGDPNTTSDTSTAQSPTWTYADTGTYTVMLVANPTWSCADTSVATYEVHLPIDPFFAQPPTACFDAQPIELTATGNFTSNASLVWTLGPSGTSTTVTGNPGSVGFSVPGTFVVELVVDEFGCEGTYADTVMVQANPVIAFSGDTVGCLPLTAQFVDLSTAATPLAWKWDLGDGSTSTAQSPSHAYTQEGSFDVRLEISTSSGCLDTLTLLHSPAVTTWPQPVAGMLVTPPTVNVLDPVVLVQDASQEAVTWTYYVEGNSFTDPSFLYTFEDAGEFIITQIVSSSQLCADTATAMVVVRDHLFYAPNTFTPNGDAINDEFLPVVKGAKEYELTIYDRWGQLVWRTIDPREGWVGDGAPQGVYVYKAYILTFGKQRQEHLGSVNLVR